MKQLSTLHFNEKQFTIQTEIVHKPQYAIRSLVYYSGKVLFKKETPLIEQSEQEILDRRVERQHLETEQQVRERVNTLLQKKVQHNTV
ncbi:hypothetical protein JXQ70_20650 [bacterium]|nr:hypothetical protein [bacterium]